MNLSVPKLDSFEFLKLIRINEMSPVIVFTGSEDPAKRQRAIELGAHDLVVKPTDIVKPTDMDEFLKVVRDALERWRRRAAQRNF